MSAPSTLDSPARTAPPVQAPPGLAAVLRACLRRARAALQWRLLLWWAILLLLPTLVAAFPVWQLLAASLDHSPFAARLAERLDLLAIADLATIGRERHAGALQAGGAVALVLTLLLSPLLTAMSAAAAHPGGAPATRLRFGALLAAGAADYGRMLRMLAWAVVPFAVAGGLAALASHAAERVDDAAILESTADNARHLAQLAALVLAVLAHATLDAGRALLAVERQRRSAVLAWCAGCRLLLRRPLALLGVYLAVTAAGLVVAGVLLLVRLRVPALGALGTVGALVLGQLVVIVLGWMRAARLFALMELVRTSH